MLHNSCLHEYFLRDDLVWTFVIFGLKYLLFDFPCFQTQSEFQKAYEKGIHKSKLVLSSKQLFKSPPVIYIQIVDFVLI